MIRTDRGDPEAGATLVADGRARAGDLPEALARRDEAFAYAERSGEQFCVPELLCLMGEVLLRGEPGDVAAAGAGWGLRGRSARASAIVRS